MEVGEVHVIHLKCYLNIRTTWRYYLSRHNLFCFLFCKLNANIFQSSFFFLNVFFRNFFLSLLRPSAVNNRRGLWTNKKWNYWKLLGVHSTFNVWSKSGYVYRYDLRVYPSYLSYLKKKKWKWIGAGQNYVLEYTIMHIFGDKSDLIGSSGLINLSLLLMHSEYYFK